VPDGGTPNRENHAYFRGIHFALSALEKRLENKADLTGEAALQEIRRYHAVVRESLAALEQQLAT